MYFYKCTCKTGSGQIYHACRFRSPRPIEKACFRIDQGQDPSFQEITPDEYDEFDVQ